jgi:hypothetical protein
MGPSGVHAAAFGLFARMLSSPPSGGSRAGSSDPWSAPRLPGMSPGASAVAINQLRLGFRTPRGRSTLLSPLLLFLVLAAMSWRTGGDADIAGIPLRGGLSVAVFACLVALLSILPLAMNQFAIDRAGLTLALLLPLDSRALLAGKMVGNGVLAALPAAACLIASAAVFRDGHPALWLSIPLALVAAYLLVSPLAAILSSAFPRAVDLTSIGNRSNAHGLAGTLGMLAFLAAAAPAAGIALVATRILERPWLAPALLLGWTALAGAVSALLFPVAVRVFERRRENVAGV